MKNSLYHLFVLIGLFIALGQNAFGQITQPVNIQTETEQASDISIRIQINGQQVDMVLPYGVDTLLHFGPSETNGAEFMACSFDLQIQYSCGSVSITVIGCTGCTGVAWSTGSNNWSIVVTTPGTYTATVTDASVGCSSVASVNIGSIPSGSLFFPGTVIVPAGCNTPGSINLSVSGGTPGYTYNWSNGMHTEDIFGLATGNYFVTVTDANGCSGIYNGFVPSTGQAPTAAFNYSVNGFTANFTNTSQNGTSYVWNFGNGQTSTQTNPSYTYASNGNYTVMLTTTNACSSVTTIQTVNIAVVAPNPPTVFITGPTLSCAGSQIQLVANATNSTNFLWSTGQSGSALNVSPSTTTTYSVTVTGTGGTASASFTVVVSPQPTPVITGPSGVCTGMVVNLTASGGQNYVWNTGFPGSTLTVGPGTYTVTVSNGGTCTATASKTVIAYTVPSVPTVTASVQNETVTLNSSGGYNSYVWTGGGNAQSFTFTPSQSGVYYVTVTNQFGCTNVSGPVPVVKTVCTVVPQNPTASFQASVNQGCAPLAVQFTNNSQNAQTYLWDFGDGFTTNQASPQHSFAAGIHTVKLTATGQNGQTHFVTQVITVTNCAPSCFMTAITNAMPTSCLECSNGSVWTTVTNGTLPLSYVWSYNGVVNNSWNTSDPQNLAAGNYCVTVTDGNNCTVVSCAFVSPPTNNPAPVADFTLTRVDCGITYLFDASSSLNSPTSWYWEFQGGVPATSTEEYPIVVFSTKGDKVIKLTVSNGNGNSSDTKVQIVNVKGITMNQGVLSGGTVEQGSYVTLQAPPGEHYHWGGIGIDGIEVPTLTSTLGMQNFSVTVTQTNGSSEVYCFTFTVVPNLVGTGDPDALSIGINTFPNPTSDFVILEGLELLTQVTVFNEVGQILNQQTYDGELDLSSYPSGVYFIAGEGMRTQRVVKQ